MNSEFNLLVLAEIGLDIDEYGNIIDQDNYNQLSYRGKAFTAKVPAQKGQVVFDPLRDQKQMNSLFMYFIDKLGREEERYVTSYYTNGTPNKNVKSSIGLVIDDGVKLNSGNYYNDSLKYMDLIIQLNGKVVGNLSIFDIGAV